MLTLKIWILLKKSELFPSQHPLLYQSTYLYKLRDLFNPIYGGVEQKFTKLSFSYFNFQRQRYPCAVIKTYGWGWTIFIDKTYKYDNDNTATDVYCKTLQQNKSRWGLFNIHFFPFSISFQIMTEENSTITSKFFSSKVYIQEPIVSLNPT